MKQSESITKLLESFTKAQADFPTLPKDKNGYNYRYTDLDTVISTVRPILAKYNLGFMQALTTLESGKWAISTRIFNNAGEWIEDTTTLPDVSLAKGNAAQNVGAAITYMKRYTLCAMLGISSDEDPDGKPDGNPDFNARNQNKNNAPRSQVQQGAPAPQLAGGPDTKEEHDRIGELINRKGEDGKPLFTKGEYNSLGKMRMTKTAQEVIRWLNEEITARTTPKVEPFPEDIPYDTQQELPISGETKKALDAIF